MYLEGAKYLDVGAGTGIWGTAIKQVLAEYGLKGDVYGVEIENRPHHPAYKVWRQADFIGDIPLFGEDMFAGCFMNPPFTPAQWMIMRAWSHMMNQAPIAALLPVNFVAGQWRHENFYPEYTPTDVYPCGQRLSFRENGKTDAREYYLSIWRKGVVPYFTRMWYGWKWDPERKTTIPTPRKVKGIPKKKKQAVIEAVQLELEVNNGAGTETEASSG